MRGARRRRRVGAVAVGWAGGVVLWGVISAGALGAVGCAEPGAGPAPAASASVGVCACGPSERVIDPALLAFLSKAKAVHHQADLAEEDGDTERATSVLASLVSGPRPGGDEPPVEVREVLADSLARLAELRSGLGRFEAAKRDVAAGLKLARERTHYRGRLQEVLGVVEQRWHGKLLEQGQTEAAKRAKERAIAAFQQAVDTQDAVIREALGDAGAGGALPR